MENYNIDYLNNLIKETGKLIDNNPLLSAGEEIESIKENFEAIQDAINNEGKEKRAGILSTIISKMVGGDKDFQYKNFEGKINSIFRQFDITKDSITDSLNMYNKYGEGLNKEVEQLGNFLSKYSFEELEGKDAIKYRNYETMLNNLKLSLGRIKLSSESAEQLEEQLITSRPIFQSVLSSCLIEVAGQRSLDASMQMLSTISGTIDGLSNKLTESTVKTSKLALEASTRPALSTGKLEENIALLSATVTELKEKKDTLLLN